jgi:hypothetical protein
MNNLQQEKIRCVLLFLYQSETKLVLLLLCHTYVLIKSYFCYKNSNSFYPHIFILLPC